MFSDEMSMGRLADFECEHGCLPADGPSDCGCFPLPSAAPLPPPEPTPAEKAQRKLNLTRANFVRVAIAEERGRISRMPYLDAAEHVANVLDHPGDVLGAMHIGHLLTAVRLIGEQKMNRMLAEAEVVSANRKLRQLTASQRGRLAWLILAWADHRASDYRRRQERTAS